MIDSLVSVIVPVYNTEKYLAECLDSILEQSYVNYEIICVNDCSTDRSLDILQEYSLRTNAIKIISNYQNSGPSLSRNVGLQYATGKYVYFVDSDDKINENTLRELTEMSERDDVDGILFDAETIFEAENLINNMHQTKRKKDYPGVYTGENLFNKLVEYGEYDVVVWRQFWKKEFLKNKMLNFKNDIILEDHLFTFQAILQANRVSCISSCYYYYRKREGSITTKRNSLLKAKSLFVSLCEMLKFWNIHNFSLETNKAITEYMLYFYKLMLKQFDALLLLDIMELSFDDPLMGYFYKLITSSYDFERQRRAEAIARSTMQLRGFRWIILYGAGNVAKETLVHLEDNGISISGVAVTNAQGNPSYLYGYPVREITDYKFSAKEEVIVIVAVIEQYNSEIVESLEMQGYKNRFIVSKI